MSDAARLGAAIAAGVTLAAHYSRIYDETLRGASLCNPLLDVEAIGFRPFTSGALGVIISPWFMNLVICSTGEAELPPAPFGAATQWLLPAGRVDFTVGSLEGFGRVDSCSLFSPMHGFEDHGAARATAEAVLAELFEPAARNTTQEPRSRRAILFGGRS